MNEWTNGESSRDGKFFVCFVDAVGSPVFDLLQLVGTLQLLVLRHEYLEDMPNTVSLLASSPPFLFNAKQR